MSKDQVQPPVEAPGPIVTPEIEPVVEAPVVEDPDPSKPSHVPRFCWCLDNGHGRLQSGKRSPVLEDGRQLLEYEFNRDVVVRIVKQLDKIGVAYFEVAPEVESIGSATKMRTSRAEKHQTKLPKIFVSVHANAIDPEVGVWDTANGIETWFKDGDEESRRIAAIFQTHIIKKTGLRNRWIKSKNIKQFYVLKHAKMPAILTENGFMTNWKEVQKLFTDEYRQQVADAHVAAILECEQIVSPEKLLP